MAFKGNQIVKTLSLIHQTGYPRILAAGVGLTLGLFGPPVWGADTGNVAIALAQKHQKAVVTVKVILKLRIQQQESEKKVETIGTVIDPSGLTVVSSRAIDPMSTFRSLMKGFGAMAAAAGVSADSDITSTALIFDDGAEMEADVVLKDADLDLAFVRPRNAARMFEAIVLTPPKTPPQLLDEILYIGRLGGSENRVLTLSKGSICAIVKAPRAYYICDNRLTTANVGCPVFANDGSTLGILVTKLSPSAAGGSGAVMGMLGGGGGGEMALPMVILRPVADVLEIAAQAKNVKLPEKSADKAPPAAFDTKPKDANVK